MGNTLVQTSLHLLKFAASAIGAASCFGSTKEHYTDF